MSNNQDHFLEHLTAELSLPSQAEAVPLVSSVMQALRQTLSRPQADVLMSRLPELFKGYLSGSSREEKQVPVKHLDELVTLVMERDKKSNPLLFKSEIQTLSVVLFTLKKLFSVVDPLAAGIPQPFFQEVKEASMGLSV